MDFSSEELEVFVELDADMMLLLDFDFCLRKMHKIMSAHPSSR